MKKIFLFLLFLVIGTFVFSADFSLAAGPTIIADGTSINTATTWKKSESPYWIKGTVNIRAELTIEPGTVIKFAYRKGNMQMFSRINAIGTANDRIIFTSERDDSHGGDTNGDGSATTPKGGDWLYINFGSTAASGEFRYISLLYAGWNPNDLGTALVINNNDDVSVTRSEIMYTRGNAIVVACARPTINENVISKNYTGIYNTCTDEIPVFRNNSIYGNFYVGASVINPVTGVLDGHIDARDNWWGDASGPKHASNASGKGNQVSGNVLFDPWLTTDPNAEPEPDLGPDPVIIIPGIMGSWEVDGEWKIDPIFHTYDNLRDEFLANGYEDGEDEKDGGNFFTFPYEWRDSNVDNAKLLAKKIEDIKAKTGRPKVDIVAHSMGGLLAREYVESNYFAGDVDQLITVGTPQLGAPKDYIKWEAGESFFDVFDMVGKRLFALEALENGYFSVYDYIHERPISSVEELLPTYNYLYDENGDDYVLRNSYPNNYPRNEFLESLNNSDRIDLLKNVDFTKIIGKQNNNESSISGYNVVKNDDDKFWLHGYPKNFNFPLLWRSGVNFSDGDKTVPLYSAEAVDILSDKTIYLESEHNALPTDTKKDILEILTGKRPAGEITKWHVPNLLLILVHSPVDIQVESPLGYKIGKNFDNNEIFDKIEGAYYTGFDTKSEFITIPNPEEGEYKILTQGTDEGGSFRIDITKIEENTNDPDNAKESTATIRGITQPGEILETKADVGTERVVATDISSIRRSIEHYADLGLIVSKGELNYYKARLKLIEALLDELKSTKKKKKPIDNIQSEISIHIDHLIEHIQKNVSIRIDQMAADIFIEDLNDLRSTIISN